MDRSKLQQILDAVPDMYFVLDGNGIIIDFKPSRTTRPVVPPEEFLGKPLAEMIPPEIAEEAIDHVRKVLETGEESRMPYSLVVEGEVGHFEVRFTRLGEGEVLSMVRDVTEHRRVDESLRSLINAAPEMAILLDREGRILAINEQAASSYDMQAEKMVGTIYWDLLDAEMAAIRMQRLATAFRTGEPIQAVDLSGNRVFEVSSNPLSGPDGRVASVAFFIRDITAKVQADQDLIESEARYRHIFEKNPVPMYIYDMDTLMILDVNRAMTGNYGYTRDEMTAMTIGDIRPPEDAKELLKNVTALRSGQIHVGQWRHLKADGAVIDVETTSSDFPFGQKRARLVLCNDVTEQTRAREDLIQSEEKFRSAFLISPDAVNINRLEDGLYLDVNDSFLAIMGYSMEEVLGKSSLKLNIWADPADRKRLVEGLRAHGRVENLEALFLRKDGTARTGLMSARVLDILGVPHILSITRDITDYKMAQDALFESEERFRAAFETSPDSIVIVDLSRRTIVDVNEGFVSTSGYEKKEVIGRNPRDIGVWDEPHGRDRLYNAIAETGSVEGFESDFRLKDGTIRKGLVSARTLDLSGHPHLLVIIRDITGLMEAQEQLKSSLDEKEVLLKEIHHRVKNNLQVISGLLNLQAHHITDPLGREVYKESQNRVITMALIHEELYQSADLAQVNFGDYIRNLCENLMISYGADRQRIDLKVDAVKADMVVDTVIPCGLIINELVTNSLKHAFPDGREGVIKVIFRPLAGEMYELIVSDDGIGIPGEMDIYRTSTLGMQLVTVLIQQLGGTLEVGTGEGTSFTMVFKEYHEAGTILY